MNALSTKLIVLLSGIIISNNCYSQVEDQKSKAFSNLLKEYVQSNQTAKLYYSIPVNYYNPDIVLPRPNCNGCGALDLVKINELGERIFGMYPDKEFIDVGTSGLKERFYLLRHEPLLPLFQKKGYYNIVGEAYSMSLSKDNDMLDPPKDLLVFETLKDNSDNQNIIISSIDKVKYKMKDLFGDIDIANRPRFKGSCRLSNNNILVVYELSYKYLSYKMSSAFGTQGPYNPSRVIDTERFFRFFIFNENGSNIIGTRDYLLPFDKIRLANDGFVVFSGKIGPVVRLNSENKGIDKSLYDWQSQGIIKIKDGVIAYNYSNLPDGVQFLKFDNNGLFQYQKVIEKIDNKNIQSPILYGLQCAGNNIAVLYTSYKSDVVNEPTNILQLFNLSGQEIKKSKYEFPLYDGFLTYIDNSFCFVKKNGTTTELIKLYSLPYSPDSYQNENDLKSIAKETLNIESLDKIATFQSNNTPKRSLLYPFKDIVYGMLYQEVRDKINKDYPAIIWDESEPETDGERNVHLKNGSIQDLFGFTYKNDVTLTFCHGHLSRFNGDINIDESNNFPGFVECKLLLVKTQELYNSCSKHLIQRNENIFKKGFFSNSGDWTWNFEDSGELRILYRYDELIKKGVVRINSEFIGCDGSWKSGMKWKSKLENQKIQ